MNKHLYKILGLILLFPTYASTALGIDIDTFEDNVFRPENLPGGPRNTPAETTINSILQFAINLILFASGSLAVFFLVLGGIRYVTSLGNQERMDGAKKTIKFAVIGLVAVILAFAVVTNVIDLIFKATV
jgi:hypothetical protein